MKPIDIANLFGVSKQRVNYWLHTPLKKGKRRTKLTRKEINIIAKWEETNRLWNKEFQQKIYKPNLINYRKK